MKDEREKVQSLERALKIMECFTMETPELFLGEISTKIKLSKSTVHRLLGTMLLCGYINQNEDNQKYSLGLKLFRLGSIVTHISHPWMKQDLFFLRINAASESAGKR